MDVRFLAQGTFTLFGEELQRLIWTVLLQYTINLQKILNRLVLMNLLCMVPHYVDRLEAKAKQI